jgi:hypothetical protein
LDQKPLSNVEEGISDRLFRVVPELVYNCRGFVCHCVLLLKFWKCFKSTSNFFARNPLFWRIFLCHYSTEQPEVSDIAAPDIQQRPVSSMTTRRSLLLLPIEHSECMPPDHVAQLVGEKLRPLSVTLQQLGISLEQPRMALDIIGQSSCLMGQQEWMSHIDWLARQIKLAVREAIHTNDSAIKAYLMDQSRQYVARLDEMRQLGFKH